MKKEKFNLPMFLLGGLVGFILLVSLRVYEDEDTTYRCINPMGEVSEFSHEVDYLIYKELNCGFFDIVPEEEEKSKPKKEKTIPEESDEKEKYYQTMITMV